MGGMLGLGAPFSVTLAERDGWGSLIYLAFFVLAGVASALGKWKKRGQDKRDQKIADVEVELEAEILPEPAPARKVERPPPSVRPSTPQLPAARSMPPPPTSFPARPPVLPTMKSVPKAAPPTPHKRRRVTQEAPAQAKAAYQEQVAVAPPSWREVLDRPHVTVAAQRGGALALRHLVEGLDLGPEPVGVGGRRGKEF